MERGLRLPNYVIFRTVDLRQLLSCIIKSSAVVNRASTIAKIIYFFIQTGLSHCIIKVVDDGKLCYSLYCRILLYLEE